MKAISRPPTAGPTTLDACMLVWFRTYAAGRRSGSTRRGMAARRAGPSMVEMPAATKAMR